MLGFRLSKKNNLLILVSFDFLKQIHQQVTPIKPSVGTKEWFNLQIFEVSSAIALQLAWQSGDGQKGKGFHDLKDHLGKTTALSICISLHLNLHIYIYNHTYLQKIISAYVYICLHIHLYIYVYIYIYTHLVLTSQVTWPSDIFLKRSLTRSSTTFLWADKARLPGHIW